jgi:putative acetyltransferase
VSGLVVRPVRAGEAPVLAEVYHAAVHEGAASAYSAEQRAAWSPAAPSGDGWAARIAGADTLVAERDGRVLGFMAWEPAKGWIDLAFVRPEAMGTGVAAALYAVIEGRARAVRIARLSVDASELARPFFARQGWRVVAREEVVRGGVTLHRYRMEKDLRAAEAAA